MNLITQLATEALVNALGWTLLHSLWQGALVALIFGLLLVLLQRHKSTLRYYLGTGAMLLQLLFSVATFVYYYAPTPAGPATRASAAGGLYFTESAVILPAAEATNWQQPLTTAQLYFEKHLPLLVTLWLLGLVVMGLRFLGGLAYMQRLRYKATTLGGKWQHSMQALANQIGVRQGVQLAESVLVKVPMVIGFAKPVILLPVGAVAGLSMAQVEAILAHELAHIRRNDYLVNLLQAIVDILFFYHPAMWWLSAAVRDERENCCDDMAVAVCGNSLVYARALTAIAEMQLPHTTKLAVALSGRKGSLLSRIKRLVEQPALKPTFSEGFMAALVIMVGAFFLSAGAMASISDKEAVKPEPEATTEIRKEAEVIFPETDAADSFTAYTFVAQDTTGQQQDVVIIKNKKGEVSELYVNGKKIPKKDIPEYSNLINQRLEAIKDAPKATRVEVQREITRERKAVAEARREAHNNREAYQYEYRYNLGGEGLAVPPVPTVPPMPPLAPMPPMPPVVPPVPPVVPLDLDGKNQEETKKQQKAYEQAIKNYEKQMKEFQENMKKQAIEMEAYTNEQQSQARTRRAEVRREEIVSRQAQAMRRHEESMRRHAESMRRHDESMKRHEEISALLDKVSAELVKDGLIKKDAEKIDFKIDDTGLYIDGKKQPQEVYSKYRGLMKTKDGKPFNYTYKKDGKERQVMIND